MTEAQQHVDHIALMLCKARLADAEALLADIDAACELDGVWPCHPWHRIKDFLNAEKGEHGDE